MSNVVVLPVPGREPVGSDLLDMLDCAQSQLDQAEKLFFEGHDVEATACVNRAVLVLGGSL